MKIIIDAMGGDNAPLEIVKGALSARARFGCDIVLTGDEAAIRDAALGVDVINDGLGHGLFRTEQGAGLEFSSIGHNEIAGGEVGHILVHIKAAGKVHRHSKPVSYTHLTLPTTERV